MVANDDLHSRHWSEMVFSLSYLHYLSKTIISSWEPHKISQVYGVPVTGTIAATPLPETKLGVAEAQQRLVL
jgi:hypothetical protein